MTGPYVSPRGRDDSQRPLSWIQSRIEPSASFSPHDRFVPWTGEANGAAPSAEHLVMDARLSSDMQRALARIPERQRAALLLAELHDLTGLELAAALGVSHVAARALLTRARESLRQALATEREADAARDRATAAKVDR